MWALAWWGIYLVHTHALVLCSGDIKLACHAARSNEDKEIDGDVDVADDAQEGLAKGDERDGVAARVAGHADGDYNEGSNRKDGVDPRHASEGNSHVVGGVLLALLERVGVEVIDVDGRH